MDISEAVEQALAVLKESVEILNKLLLFMFDDGNYTYKSDKDIDAYRNLRDLCSQALEQLPDEFKQGDDLRTISGRLCDEVVLYTEYNDESIRVCKRQALHLERDWAVIILK